MDVVFRSQRDVDNWADLPEPPPPSTTNMTTIEDNFYYGLESYISALVTHINSIQDDELTLMNNFVQKLNKERNRTKKDAEEADRQEFVSRLQGLRKKRRVYREMEREALDERRRYLDSMLQQQQEQEYLRYKLWKLQALPDESSVRAKRKGWWFSVIAFIMQVIFFVLFIVGVEFADSPTEQPLPGFENNGQPSRIDDYFTFYTHISLMLFFGWGLQSAWLKKFGFGSLMFTFFVAATALEWNFLTTGMFASAYANGGDVNRIPMTMENMIRAAYGATSAIVMLGAVLGKINFLEASLITWFHSLMYAVNQYVTVLVLGVADPGGAMSVHLFGAMFGLGVTVPLASSYINLKSPTHELRASRSHLLQSTYTSDLISLVGTLFLIVGFPSFNGADIELPDGVQHRVVLNTWLGIISSTVVAFLLSRVFRHTLFEMRDIQSVSLTGGIAMASAHSFTEQPAVALVVGGVAAATAMLWIVFAAPYFERRFLDSSLKLVVFDTRNVIAIHGVAGFIGGFASLVAVALADSSMIYGTPVGDLFRHDLPRQAGFQTAGLVISFGIGLGSGAIAGIATYFARRAMDSKLPAAPFSDEAAFVLPSDFPRSPVAN